MILEQQAITRKQLVGLAPLGLQDVASQTGNAPHSMICGQAQAVAFQGPQMQDLFGGGFEKAILAGSVILPVYAREKRLADQVKHLARTRGGVNPGVAGHARVGRPDILAKPVVVHLVRAVDQDEPRFGVIVSGRHDHVPQAPGADFPIYFAGDLPDVVDDQTFRGRPLAPDDLAGVVQIDAVLLRFFGQERERQQPVGVVFDRFHELAGDQQRQVELAEPTRLALGADEFHDIGMADVEGAHLRAPPTARRRHGEAHLVVDIHERQRPRGVGPRAGDVGAARPQRGKLVADAGARFERQARFVHLAQNVVHRVANSARNRAVDGGRGRFVFPSAGVGNDPPRRNGAMAQGPQKLLAPKFAQFLGGFHRRQRLGHALIGAVDGLIDRSPVLGLEPVFLVPDVPGRGLHRHVGGSGRTVDRLQVRGSHKPASP